MPLPTAQISIPDGSGAPAEYSAVFDDAKAMILDLWADNLGFILAMLGLVLVVRFAPALLSWFRHRNDPKQMSEF
jgi:hypothetical protein